MKIIQIVPFFGKTPSWIEYFLKSCSRNPQIFWMLFGDISLSPGLLPGNVFFVYSSMESFNKLVSKKLLLKIEFSNAYKVCDLRPAFGKIFEDYIKEYDYWGYSDLDLIYGTLSNFLPFNSIEQYDVIASRDDYFPGHFMLFRNTKENKYIFKGLFNYKNILKDYKRHYAVDERSNLIGKSFAQNEKISVYRIWKYRLLKLLPFNHDMNSILKKRRRKDEQQKFLCLSNAIKSDNFYKKKDISNWECKWENGKLTDQLSGKELMYFHFLKSKSNLNFAIETYKINKSFIIDCKGIRCVK